LICSNFNIRNFKGFQGVYFYLSAHHQTAIASVETYVIRCFSADFEGVYFCIGITHISNVDPSALTLSGISQLFCFQGAII
jgi:hypothetical protein